MTAVQNARAAVMVLGYADHHGLPEPTDVEISPTLRLGFDNLADLTEWALLLESVITERESPPFRHYRAHGEILEAPVECWHVEVAPVRTLSAVPS